jgi:hypothetical protein
LRERIKVGIDQNVELKALRALQRQGLIELRQANELEQNPFRDVVQQKKGFMLGYTKLGGPDELAKGEVVEELQEIIGLANGKDIGHIYACYINECDYFVTEDVKDFINNGRREALESLLGLKIRRTKELIQEITGKK